MAQRRPKPVATPPEKLVTFDVDEWAERFDRSWAAAFRRWQLARHEWVKSHPDTILGDQIDVLRAEHDLRKEILFRGNVA
ncbi:MAG: hypothetical protein WAN44_00180 [Propionibacteriaceae bacterium]